MLPTPVFWPGEFHGLYRSWDHKIGHAEPLSRTSLIAQLVKNLPAVQETWVPSLG